MPYFDILLEQVCEVEVTLRRSAKARQFKPGDSTEVLVHAMLTPEGHRAYRIQGRTASGVEVKKKLKALGISLGGPSSLIRQDAVTQLADAGDPALLAGVVAESSGLGPWMRETAAAYLEMDKIKKDGERISQRIAQLV